MKFVSNPMVRLGLPTMGAVVLGTLFFSELVRINALIPNRPTGIREEDIVDKFDINKELEVRNEARTEHFFSAQTKKTTC